MSSQPFPQPDNFQYIKLPDGSYGKFAGDASDDVIRSAVSKDFPQAFGASGQSSPPGALSRLGTSAREAVGLPANPAQDITSGLAFAKANPGEAAKQIAMSPIESYKNAVNTQYQRMVTAKNQGNYGEAGLQGLYYLLSAVGGANLGKATDQAKTEDYAGSLGTTIGTALPFALGSPEARSNLAVPVNATRSALATGLEKSAGPVSTAATLVGSGSELLSGHPYQALLTAALGKPAISRVMNLAAKVMRPAQGMEPLGMAPGFNPAWANSLPLDTAEAPTVAPPISTPPTSAWPPGAARNVLQPTGKMTPTQLQDILETRGIQEAMQQDLERHGQSALSQERRTFFANNQPGMTKTDLIQQATDILKRASSQEAPAITQARNSATTVVQPQPSMVIQTPADLINALRQMAAAKAKQ